MTTSYPQQQHGSCYASSGQRKHLNLLIWDQLDNIGAIYAGTGRRPTWTLSPHRPLLRSAPSGDSGLTARQRFHKTFEREVTQPAEFHGLGEPHTTTALRTLRSPADHHLQHDGSDHQLYQQHTVAYSQPASPVPPAHEYAQEAAAPLPAAAARPSTVGSLPSLGLSLKPRPWAMPWQTGDREAGKQLATMVRSRRTPSGAFANLDLAKAAK